MSIIKSIREYLLNDESIDLGKDIAEIVIDGFLEDGVQREHIWSKIQTSRKDK